MPRMRDGSWVLWGAARSSSGRGVPGVPGVLGLGVDRLTSEFLHGLGLSENVTSEPCRPGLALASARGMLSVSLPSSSARSVNARLVEPRMSWRPRTK